MPSRMVPAQELSDAGEDLVRLAAAKDAALAALTEQRDILTGRLEELVAFTELRRQNAEKADLLDRCIALFRRNGDYPTLTQEIVAALTSGPQAALTEQRDRALAGLQEIADMEGAEDMTDYKFAERACAIANSILDAEAAAETEGT